ncbi:hypothetical protein DL93DRAFT_2233392 [Clavulina sp. PMI_390]|nr:hypothetical protein DL93DRAFT_2233392 [Clavulina sp. PMI_390]
MSVEPINDFLEYKRLVDSGRKIVLAFLIPFVPEGGQLLFILRKEAERAQEHGADLQFFHVDPLVHRDIAEDANVKHLPVVVAFKDRKESGRVSSVDPHEVEEFIRKGPDSSMELKPSFLKD